MRKIDKKNNFKKVNLLSEQRYLESKGLVKESFHNADGTPIGVDSMHRPVSEEAPIDRMYGSDEWVQAQQDAGKDISAIKSEYTSKLYAMEKPYYSNNEVLDTIIKIYQSHIQQLGTMMGNNGVDSELNEDGLSDYSTELNNTGDYPWIDFLGDKQKGGDYKNRNQQANEKFKIEFNNNYKGQSVETTNGRYFFETLKYTNNFGKYDLIFMRPKSEDEYNDKTLFIKYDPSNVYYIDSNDDIELMDKDSVDKVIDMLKYNK